MGMFTNALSILLLAAIVLYLGYKVYGTLLARRVFHFDDGHVTPAVEFNDGLDFVPSHRSVLFGHHFASIAGLGPIIGPAIAVYWGWLPALIWVLAGCVLIGGVHDMAALYASMRHQGRGIGDLTSEVIGNRARWLFQLIIFFLLALAMGVFAIVMANLFNDLSPQAVVPTFSLIVIAIVIGTLVFKFHWKLGRVTLVGVVLMCVTTYMGLEAPVPLYRAFLSHPQVEQVIADSNDPDMPHVQGIRATRADPTLAFFRAKAETDPTWTPLADDIAKARDRSRSAWVYTLLFYAFIASILPVWLLLQPRDYINCFQLYIALAVLIVGFIVWHPTIQAPALHSLAGNGDDTAPPMLPFIFITIACGAVSGFHSLVSSGTTARQISRESDAHLIGYGAMLTEGLLAVLVILACVAGLSKVEFQEQYGVWSGLDKRALGAFLTGAGHVVAQPFLWLTDGEAGRTAALTFCRNFVAVVVVSFAMTTLDSGTRLLRYNVEELGRGMGLKFLQNRYVASLIAVAAIGYFALMKINGKPAGVVLWQIFGTSNQLLAVLGLLVVTLLLYQLGKPILYTLIPMGVMIVSVTWAIGLKLGDFYRGWRETRDPGHLSLFIIGAILAVMGTWMLIEGALAFRRSRRERKLALIMDDASASVPGPCLDPAGARSERAGLAMPQARHPDSD